MTSVSTHVLDTSRGRPAAGVAVAMSYRTGPDRPWTAHATRTTDADGRCADLPEAPHDAVQVRLDFAVEPYLARRAGQGQDAPHPDGPGTGAAFFPEVAVAFTVAPGEHHHVPLLLSPYGYSVYRGS